MGNNRLYIYCLENNHCVKFAILEQIVNGRSVFLTLSEQGDNDFWFTDDYSEHPMVDINNWFSSHEEAFDYLEEYCYCNLVFLMEEPSELSWTFKK